MEEKVAALDLNKDVEEKDEDGVPYVKLLGKSHKPLADGQYDAIVLSTGLEECVLAGLLSIRGKKVLQIDRNAYYGGSCASLNLKELFEQNGKPFDAAAESMFGSSRKYCVDLAPKFCMANGKLIKMLIQTGVTRYMDFNGIQGSYVLNNGKVYRIPVTPREVLTSSLVGFRQKFSLRGLADFCIKYNAPRRVAYTLTTEEFKQRLVEYYQLHNSTKVADIDGLIERFDTKRDMLVAELERKYGFPVFEETVEATFEAGPLGISLETKAIIAASPAIANVVGIQKFLKGPDGKAGQAEKSGRLQPGYYIYKVAGKSVIGLADTQVQKAIVEAPRPLKIVFLKPLPKVDPSAPDLTKMTMRQLYDHHKTSEDNQNMIGHAMALHTDDTYLDRTAEETVMAIKLYAQSMGRFGQDSPYLYPMYGLSCLPEGFSRLAAIYGSTVMLRTDVDEILTTPEGRAVGVRCGDKVAAAPIIIGDSSFFPEDKSVKVGQVIRSVCLLKHRVKSTKEGTDSAQIILPARHVPGKTQDIYISQLSAGHNVAPPGVILAIASTQVESGNPSSELQAAFELMQPIAMRFDTVSNIYAPVSDGTKDGCFLTKSLDATSHFESAAKDIMRIYKNIFGVELDLEKKIVADPE